MYKPTTDHSSVILFTTYAALDFSDSDGPPIVKQPWKIRLRPQVSILLQPVQQRAHANFNFIRNPWKYGLFAFAFVFVLFYVFVVFGLFYEFPP
jgi:hypothetical protein